MAVFKVVNFNFAEKNFYVPGLFRNFLKKWFIWRFDIYLFLVYNFTLFVF